MSNICF